MTSNQSTVVETPTFAQRHETDSASANFPPVTFVLPALDEAENLPFVLPLIPSWATEIILVDGRSHDNTVEVARQLNPNIRVITQTLTGKGDALRAGFAAASGLIIVTLDADGSTDPREAIRFIQALMAGADYVKGSRFLPGGGSDDMTRLRRLANRCLPLLVRLLFGGRYSDLCYGYNAFWQRVFPALRLDATGFEIETMMNIRALVGGFKVVEVPSFEARRIYGTGRLRAVRDGLRVLRTILIERLNPPMIVDNEAEPAPVESPAQ